MRLGSPGIDRGTFDSPLLPETDFEGDPRNTEGDRVPPAGIDIGADELVREVAACFGAVGAFHASIENVLFVNGEAGDARRIVRVATRERITIDMAASSSGPTPAPFALYLWTSPPDATTRGAPLELTATLQGILRDDGSEASVPYSLTNAIVLEIRKP